VISEHPNDVAVLRFTLDVPNVPARSARVGGFIVFGALDRMGSRGKVVASDISRDLVKHMRVTAADLGVADRDVRRSASRKPEFVEEASMSPRRAPY
jgi:hypothetical protein